MGESLSLSELGWKTYFQQQLDLDEFTAMTPARIVAQYRSRYEVAWECGTGSLSITPAMPVLTVGDWLLLDADHAFVRALDRVSLFSRKGAGSAARRQLIAANVDTVFIVSSLNHNFRLNRIERYLSLAHEAGVEPVVVLTRADDCADPASYRAEVQALDAMMMVQAVNALDPASVESLRSCCGHGQTVALLGSSGVGKSTLINTLLGSSETATGAIRDADSKGRHTTTARSLHHLPDGGLLLDTPGMRELQLADCEDGVAAVFADIEELASRCRFSDCEHRSEPGCAVREAIASDELDPRRLANYDKLMREQRLNAATLAERRAGDRELARMYQTVQTASRERKKGQ